MKEKNHKLSILFHSLSLNIICINGIYLFICVRTFKRFNQFQKPNKQKSHRTLHGCPSIFSPQTKTNRKKNRENSFTHHSSPYWKNKIEYNG